MPNVEQLLNTARKTTITAGKKGFFRRIAEKIGLVQKEVQECRGKSLEEMAAITSKKDGFKLKMERWEDDCEYTLEDHFIRVHYTNHG